MLDKSKIIGFVATTNPDAAKDFYQRALGLTLVSDDQFAIVFDANGITIRVTKVQEFTPLPFNVLGWEVDAIEDKINVLKENGVAFERFPGLP